MKSQIEYENLGKLIINSAFDVHKELGPGLLESVCETCLVDELKGRKLNILNQVKLPIVYKGKELDKEFIIDILVENSIIIELKAIELILPVHEFN